MTVANGTFEVKLEPQAATDEAREANIGQLAIDKHFSGDLEASSRGMMISVMGNVEGSAGYVALERVSGKLDGRSGTFALQHNGIMARGAPELTIRVVPDSGTGELANLEGQMTIIIADGKHSYRFEYNISKDS
jgi:hypothetical protein